MTGTVAANTAIGSEKASMLETATTSSITNSMKVPVLSDHADRLHQVEHPGEAEEQVEQHEAHAATP